MRSNFQSKICNLKVQMTTNGQNKVGNEFLMQKSVLKVVLHLRVDLELKKLGFSS